MSGPIFAEDYAALTVRAPEYRVRPIIPKGRLLLLVGNSTQGKTPFSYQMARDIAAGNDVLDYFESSSPSRVGIVDAESSQEDVALRLEMQSKRPAKYEDGQLLIWSAESVHSDGISLNRAGMIKLTEIVADCELGMVVLDNLHALSGGIDISKANLLHPLLMGLKAITRLPCAPSIVLCHHPRKGGREDKRPNILTPDFTRWLEEASGSYLLTNLTDVRLGLERIETHGEEVTVLRGRTRVPGGEQDIGPLYLTVDEEHSLAAIDCRPQVLNGAGKKISAVLDCLRGTGLFTMKQALSKCAHTDASSKTIRRAVHFAKAHGFVTESKPGVYQWRTR